MKTNFIQTFIVYENDKRLKIEQLDQAFYQNLNKFKF